MHLQALQDGSPFSISFLVCFICCVLPWSGLFGFGLAGLLIYIACAGGSFWVGISALNFPFLVFTLFLLLPMGYDWVGFERSYKPLDHCCDATRCDDDEEDKKDGAVRCQEY